LATDERLERWLTLYSVMAWWVFYASMLARAVPEMPCDVLLALEEWQALYGALHHCPTPPERPPSRGEAVRWIAQLGGFVGRRRRDQPGAETLWRGTVLIDGEPFGFDTLRLEVFQVVVVQVELTLECPIGHPPLTLEQLDDLRQHLIELHW
jgi:hypothetical protein